MSLSDPAWVSFVEGHPDATPFHHPAWAGALAGAYGLRASGLAALDAAGEIEVAIPVVRLGGRASRRRAKALPFTDWCPPLARAGIPAEGVADRLERARSELGLGPLVVRDRLAGEAGARRIVGLRHVLALEEDSDAVFRGFDRSRVRRKLRRAERAGLEIRRGSSPGDLLGTFYPLHVTTRRRLGVPVQPRRFFTTLAREVLGRGLGFVTSAWSGETPIAAAVILAWNRRAIYKFAASSRELGDVGAAQAVVWDAVRWSCENGCADFDFGRTDLGQEGLRDFKRAWGSAEHELTYTTLSEGPPRGVHGSGRAERILGHVIRRSPELVTRAAGRVGYRYTA